MDIKEFYINTYPTDELGKELKENITFKEVFECLDNYNNIYEFVGVCDSLVRERIFTKLSEIMEVDYNYIYDQWLKCK